jgi:hypothetical protein
VPDVHRRVRGVQPGDVGAQLADLGDQGLSLSHSTSISTLTPMSTPSGRRTHEATAEGRTGAAVTGQGPAQLGRARLSRNLIHYNKLDRGGHFAAREQPDLFAAEMRDAFRTLRWPGRGGRRSA